MNQRLATTSASERRATASVCRAVVRKPKVPATRGTATGPGRPDSASTMVRRPLRRRLPPSGVREPEHVVEHGEHARSDRQPDHAVPYQRLGKADEPRVLLRRRPVLGQLFQRVVPVQAQHRQHRSHFIFHGPQGDHVAEEEADRGEVYRDNLPCEHPKREQDRACEDQVGQEEEQVRLHVRGRAEGAECRRVGIPHQHGQGETEGDRDQHDGVDRQRGEEATAQVFGLAQRGREQERIYFGLDVAHRRVAEERC